MDTKGDLDRLIEILKSRGHRSAREDASRQLQDYGDAAVERLGTLLMESTGVIAEIAASTLSRIGVSAIPALAKALREGGHGRRNYASIALANIGNAAIPALKDATKDGDRGVRWRAFNALASIGAPAIPFIASSLFNSDDDNRLLVLQATKWELTRVDTPDIQPCDADGKTILPCLAKLLNHKDREVEFFARGVIEKIGLPLISPLALYVVNECKDIQIEKNCIISMRGILFGRGVKSSEAAGVILQQYIPALFARANRIDIGKIRKSSQVLSRQGIEQALLTPDHPIHIDMLYTEYQNLFNDLFNDLGIYAVPVLAPAWQNGTVEQRELADLSMDGAFNSYFFYRSVPHLLYDPKDYDGPTSIEDEIFDQLNPNSFSDVRKIVLALEYKYFKVLDETRPQRTEEFNSLLDATSSFTEDKRREALQRLSAKHRPTIDSIDSVRERALATIKDKGVFMLPHILDIAQQGDDELCLCALEALSFIKRIDEKVLSNNPDLLLVLIRFVRIPHMWYRNRAIAAAAHIGQPLLPFLARFINDADELDKLAAVAAMGSVGVKGPTYSVGVKARTYIEPLTLDRDKAVAAFASWCMQR